MTTRASRPIVASLGDPAGIGPELFCAAWSARVTHGLTPFAVVGSAELLRAAAKARGVRITVTAVANTAEAAEVFERALPVIDLGPLPYTPGVPDRAGAQLALAALTEASRLATCGEAAAVVTGPISKAALHEVGFNHPGQTEFVAAAAGVAAEDAVMMLAGPQLRTVPLTVHLALAKVPAALTTELIVRRGKVVAAALRNDFGISAPHLAVAALNPHASENGAFGDEEARIIGPAIAALQAEGINATGPHPADSLFQPRARSHFDAALCMYHDQALIPLKALDFDAGVNVTLGLPIIRTSPDHGTAFAIAGKAEADAGATIAALRLAGAMAARRAAG